MLTNDLQALNQPNISTFHRDQSAKFRKSTDDSATRTTTTTHRLSKYSPKKHQQQPIARNTPAQSQPCITQVEHAPGGRHAIINSSSASQPARDKPRKNLPLVLPEAIEVVAGFPTNPHSAKDLTTIVIQYPQHKIRQAGLERSPPATFRSATQEGAAARQPVDCLLAKRLARIRTLAESWRSEVPQPYLRELGQHSRLARFTLPHP